MLKIYGTMLCRDCVACCAALDQSGIRYEFLEFGDSLENLRDFLALRDHHEVFTQIRGSSSIGIPCLVKEDGSVTLNWEEFM